MKVAELKIGDTLRNINNHPYFIKEIRNEKDNEMIIITFNMAGEHWFFWSPENRVPFRVIRDEVEMN